MHTPRLQESRYLKLPVSFDCQRLQAELQIIESGSWISHFNTQAYESNWSCIPLRSIGGSMSHIMPIENNEYQDTEILKNSPYLQEVISQFKCEKTSIRFMSLASGGVIKLHNDPGTSINDGLTRLHIPIQTSPEVLFHIDGEDVHFSAGDTWYLNASFIHGVSNRSSSSRIHLMLDCITNPWLEQVFIDAGWVSRAPPKYADPNINDGNVKDIIHQLRQSSHSSSQALADKLEKISNE